jgi:hypothetical protein
MLHAVDITSCCLSAQCCAELIAKTYADNRGRQRLWFLNGFHLWLADFFVNDAAKLTVFCTSLHILPKFRRQYSQHTPDLQVGQYANLVRLRVPIVSGQLDVKNLAVSGVVLMAVLAQTRPSGSLFAFTLPSQFQGKLQAAPHTYCSAIIPPLTTLRVPLGESDRSFGRVTPLSVALSNSSVLLCCE